MMNSDLLLLIGSIIGGAGAMLSYWAGWNARDRERQPRGSYGLPPRYRPGYCSINYPDPSQDRRLTNPYSGEPITLTEGSTQSGNRNGGPTKPKPEIVPKPQFPPGRIIGADGMTIGYRPIPSRPDANPPPREP